LEIADIIREGGLVSTCLVLVFGLVALWRHHLGAMKYKDGKIDKQNDRIEELHEENRAASEKVLLTVEKFSQVFERLVEQINQRRI